MNLLIQLIRKFDPGFCNGSHDVVGELSHVCPSEGSATHSWVRIALAQEFCLFVWVFVTSRTGVRSCQAEHMSLPRGRTAHGRCDDRKQTPNRPLMRTLPQTMDATIWFHTATEPRSAARSLAHAKKQAGFERW